VAVALVVPDHAHHQQAVRAIGDRRAGLAGHAAFETFSVLTRLPPPLRRTPQAALTLLNHDFPASRYLSTERAAGLLSRLAAAGIAGGAVHDALVGATALEHKVTLATRDRRALETYRSLDVKVELIS